MTADYQKIFELHYRGRHCSGMGQCSSVFFIPLTWFWCRNLRFSSLCSIIAHIVSHTVKWRLSGTSWIQSNSDSTSVHGQRMFGWWLHWAPLQPEILKKRERERKKKKHSLKYMLISQAVFWPEIWIYLISWLIYCALGVHTKILNIVS